jgi:hypothetical protein
MHGLRQRHCPITTPTLLCWKWPRLAALLCSHCQLECKITAQNKISRKVKLLACDLMWRICTPFLAPVNIRYARQHGTRRVWLARIMERRPIKVAAVALANKIARVAWAMIVRAEPFKEPRLLPAAG